MNHYRLLLLLTISIIQLGIQTFGQSVRLPAEWEQQDRVWLSLFGNIRRDSVSFRVIEALQPHVKVSMHVWQDSMIPKSKILMSKYAIDTSTIDLHVDPHASFWVRDHIFFVEENNELKIVCFNWTVYGLFPDLLPGPMSEETRKSGEYDERQAVLLNMPVIKSDYVFEAGGIETNGKGTFIIIKEMALQRNPNRSLREIEEELMRTLGAKKIIWLKDGLIEDRQFKNMGPFFRNYFGGGANMHVDELCRFVNETTVVFPYIDQDEKNKSPIDSINYEMLESNYDILKNATTWDGKKIKVVRIPMPEIEPLKFTLAVDSNSYKQLKVHGFNIGDTIFRVPAASYCNYFVSNDVLLIQKYWKPGMSESQRKKDEESRRIFEQLFPGRKAIAIFTHSINRGGGGIHCMTHEQPAVRK